MESRPLRQALGAVLLVAAHFLAAAMHGDSTILRESVFWIPTGIGVAGVWLLGPRAALYVAAATFLHRIFIGRSLPASLYPAVGNGLEALTAWALLRRFRFDPHFGRLRDVFALIAAAVIAPVASAGLAALMYVYTNHPYAGSPTAAWGWWRMNSLGILVITPTILSWTAGDLGRPSRRSVLEVAGGAAVIAVFLWLMVLNTHDGEIGMILSYLSLGGILYAAVRFGPRGAATVATILSLIAVMGTLFGHGPFVSASAGARVLALQAFVLVLTVAPLMLGALIGERGEAVAERRRSDLALHAFQEVLPDFTYRLNADGVYLDMYVPPGQVAAMQPEQVLGHRLEDTVPEHAPRMRQLLAAALAGAPPEPIEYEMRVGRHRWVREARFVRVAPGEALCLVRDITDRKRAEDLLAWQARVLELVATGYPTRDVLETIVLGIESQTEGGLCSVLLLEGRRVHVALAPSLPASYNALIEGVEIGPAAGSCGTAAYHNRTVVVSDIATDPLWADYRAAALPHGLRACWSVPLRGAAGEVLGTFAVYYREPRSPLSAELSLVERAASLAAIAIERERREDLLASVNRNVAEGIFRSTPERGMVYVNRAFATMFGHDSPEAMLQVPSLNLYADPARREELKRLIAREGFFTNEEVQFLRRDGSQFSALVSSTAVRGLNGTIQYYDGAVWDITDRKQLEEQLRQAQKMEAVGKLAGGVAHDFNNLLTAIGGYAEALLTTLPPDGVAYQDALEITRASSRAASLTRQLLAYSRQQILSPSVLDLQQVVDQLGGMLRRLIGEDIKLITQHAAGETFVRVDRGQIEQVILNLVLNARDAMPQGGSLTVATMSVELDEAYARAHVGMTAGPHVCLLVQDTGSGMDAATRNRAFDPFFTTKEPGKGTGLGLSTVYGIVKQSGGSVWLDSIPGAGTTVRVYLPRVQEHPEEEQVASLGPAAPVQGATVLVVEDEQLVRDLVSRTLRRAGYTVMVAEHGDEALAISRTHVGPIDLMVTDVVMPRMNGSDLANRLVLERPGLRVLFVSGYPSEALDLRGGLESGMEYLQKPFTPSVLLDRVRELLTTERARV
jgi:PAS domain S-box-containing protein